VPEVAHHKEWLEHAWQCAQAAIKAMQNVLVTWGQHKKGQRHYKGHTVSNQVWLEGTNLKLSHLKAKLDTKWYRPFRVIKEISLVVFRLELPQQWKIHNVFHASLLMRYNETEEHGRNFAQPAPELIEGKEEYEVEQVLNSRHFGHTKKLQYLLCWKGYSHVHDSWQDTTDIHTPDLVKEYYQRKPMAVRTTMLKGEQDGFGGNPMFQNSLTEIYDSEDDTVILFAQERLNQQTAEKAFINNAWMETQFNASPLVTLTMAKPLPSKEDPAEHVVAHPPKRGGDVTVLWLGPQRSGQPTQTLSTSSSGSSSCNSNTSSSSASQSALQAVAPDTLDRWTARVLAAHWATWQEQHDKSTFPAQLAEALWQHGMAVQAGHTSTHVMQGIMHELMCLKHAWACLREVLSGMT
jgi:Chromo (CHRromatin Organisation MOdifier) domain